MCQVEVVRSAGARYFTTCHFLAAFVCAWVCGGRQQRHTLPLIATPCGALSFKGGKFFWATYCIERNFVYEGYCSRWHFYSAALVLVALMLGLFAGDIDLQSPWDSWYGYVCYTSQSPIAKVSTAKFVRKNSPCLIQQSQILLLRRQNVTAPLRIVEKRLSTKMSGWQYVDIEKLKTRAKNCSHPHNNECPEK